MSPFFFINNYMKYLLEYTEWVEAREVEIHEELDLSKWAHLAADVTSAISDTAVPGSGAIIDLIHSISYWIEASLSKDPVDKLALNLQGLVTLGSIVAIGAFQAAAVSFKTELIAITAAFRKGANPTTISLAKKSAASASANAQKILSMITDIAKWVGGKLSEFKNSALGTWLIEKFGSFDQAVTKVTGFMTVSVPNSIKEFLQLLAKLNPSNLGSNSVGGEAGEVAIKQLAKHMVATNTVNKAVNTLAKTTQSTNNQIAQAKSKSNSKKV